MTVLVEALNAILCSVWGKKMMTIYKPKLGEIGGILTFILTKSRTITEIILLVCH